MLKLISTMCNCTSILRLTLLTGLIFLSGLGTARAAGETAEVPSQPIPMTSPLVTTSFIPLLPHDGGPNALPQFMPVASSEPMDGSHPDITRVIIGIHDKSRDATRMLLTLQTLAGAENEHTMMIAPQFLLEADIIRFERQLPDKGRLFARWPLSGLTSPWESGGDSVPMPPQPGISSFTAIDILLMYLADRARFPSLQQIILVGHGRGGDFVQRYAALGRAPDILLKKNLAVRYVVVNAESYLYFTPQRPHGSKHGFSAPADTKDCPDFDAYPYGLDKLNPYAGRVGANAIKLDYAAKHVFYMIGDAAALEDISPDISCGAQMQGLNRLMRTQHYGEYLDMLYGDAVEKNQSFIRVPKVGLDLSAILGSRCGMSVLFDDGVCR